MAMKENNPNMFHLAEKAMLAKVQNSVAKTVMDTVTEEFRAELRKIIEEKMKEFVITGVDRIEDLETMTRNYVVYIQTDNGVPKRYDGPLRQPVTE